MPVLVGLRTYHWFINITAALGRKSVVRAAATPAGIPFSVVLTAWRFTVASFVLVLELSPHRARCGAGRAVVTGPGSAGLAPIIAGPEPIMFLRCKSMPENYMPPVPTRLHTTAMSGRTMVQP